VLKRLPARVRVPVWKRLRQALEPRVRQRVRQRLQLERAPEQVLELRLLVPGQRLLAPGLNRSSPERRRLEPGSRQKQQRYSHPSTLVRS
jgi:hypothetical protein